MAWAEAPIKEVTARAYRVPTDAPEADGTFAWERTTLIVVQVKAGGKAGLGYTYSSMAAVQVIASTLAPVLMEEDAFSIPRLWQAMVGQVRNMGWRGIAATAISAVDVALWDLKARLLGIPLPHLFGLARKEVPIYGSGGFTSYSDERLQDQLGAWVHENGCRFVKMKIGSKPRRDLARMKAAKESIGDSALMIDANGAFDRKEALLFAEQAADLGVIWFEEPVSSDDFAGLRLLRDRAPTPVEIAAGEYGYEPFYFKRMMDAGAVDVVQADATRCCGYTGFLKVAALADAEPLPLSAHTAPSLHLPVCCAAPRLRHIEWFHDHVRIEQILFDGAPDAKGGVIRPDLSQPGHGLIFKSEDAERFSV
ncbi:enolase C-terminal domain-like protein [Microvirga roseola]|uniref:enolase C-terminal domain-like protein n=1 Tax=Microvirga roseola TaxID=2883126 RepID=UPI001E36CF79|nr:enolase C-terminal domain-like protein [Microvirga roseola]